MGQAEASWTKGLLQHITVLYDKKPLQMPDTWLGSLCFQTKLLHKRVTRRNIYWEHGCKHQVQHAAEC